MAWTWDGSFVGLGDGGVRGGQVLGKCCCRRRAVEVLLQVRKLRHKGSGRQDVLG